MMSSGLSQFGFEDHVKDIDQTERASCAVLCTMRNVGSSVFGAFPTSTSAAMNLTSVSFKSLNFLDLRY